MTQAYNELAIACDLTKWLNKDGKYTRIIEVV